MYAPDFDKDKDCGRALFEPHHRRNNGVDAGTVKDSRWTGSPCTAGHWARSEHDNPRKSKNYKVSGKPKGFKAPRTDVPNRAAFEKRLRDLVRSNPEIAARFARQMTR